MKKRSMTAGCLPLLFVVACSDAPIIDRTDTSLFGTELDGALRVDQDGELIVDEALRRRFDYFLLLEGEVSSDRLDTYVRQHFSMSLPARAAATANETWAAYLRYRTEGRTLWESSATERYERTRTLRRQVLGQETATRFFGDEERRIDSTLARRKLETGSERKRPVGLLDRLRDLRETISDPEELLRARIELVGEDAAQRLTRLDERRE